MFWKRRSYKDKDVFEEAKRTLFKAADSIDKEVIRSYWDSHLVKFGPHLRLGPSSVTFNCPEYKNILIYLFFYYDRSYGLTFIYYYDSMPTTLTNDDIKLAYTYLADVLTTFTDDLIAFSSRGMSIRSAVRSELAALEKTKNNIDEKRIIQ